ncbi:retinal guanylyl cyclase 2 isoform X1 [Onthophagus taurus]|uniref:retinal guanylyl cyclase 2 isoform X1 n=1 Tax=Onthophagus taurus TaxID=166361 RepID=UPI0039BDC50E
MALLLLLPGLLSCTPFASPQITTSPLFSPLVFVSEICYYNNINIETLEQELNMTLLPTKDICGNRRYILETISQSSVPVIASLEAELCSKARILSKFHNITLRTWNCPQKNREDLSNSGPSMQDIAKSLSLIARSMKWKSIAIISSDIGWWPTLSQNLDIELRTVGIIPKLFFVFSKENGLKQIVEKLGLLHKNICRVIIICMPPDKTGRRILRTLDDLQIAAIYNTLTILIDISSLPSWTMFFRDQTINNITNNQKNRTNIIEKYHHQNQISTFTKKYVLILSEESSVDNNDSFYNDLESTLQKNIKRSLNLSNTTVKLVLSDLKDDEILRPLLSISRDEFGTFRKKERFENLEEWRLKHADTEDCDNCETRLTQLLSVLAVFGFCSVSIALVFGVVIVARNQLIKKRVSKGTYKVLLTATDFVFPQLADSRRVDEGIEAMLCCWLQQLQEFGGPEVDKPDLLQGSGAGGGAGGNARTPLRGGSSPSLAKQLIVDPRVRYNGDLVQMKPVGFNTNSVELKGKTVELLVVLHGLRHENLNPLIGCLAEPPRAALVSEYCARGSLQDVLQQDDIKLDWSFRLSLLTDLVRGMKYLHSTPIRIHGYLTSRNCVIDARWVLKVTDYGMPAFYESQGITPPQKNAKELLWTAPELLRHSSLRKKGTQPGDVYSFGIILQEVVVRGEPFCMLSLGPEEIIEKVKKPPPLIRPSVSKGAAPPEAINIMRQCWAEQADMRPDFNTVHDQFKKLNHGRKVNIVDTMFQMLEKYSNNLEELIRERTEQLDVEKKKTEQLLNRMLPSSVAEKLKLGQPVDPEEFEEVTIYFSDIVGFTTISAHSTPFQVVDLLNDLYTCFDATINAYNVYKVETIGDAYMVVGGLPVRVPDHAEQVATMALDLLHQSGKFCIRHLPGTPLRLRIGLHTGPCCAGVVGLTMPRYCLFGDTVNTASRMESAGAAWRIHLSETTKERLEKAGGYNIEYRGATEIKGKGVMDTYWLLGKSGFVKVLPTPPPIEESHGLDESLVICDNSLLIQKEDQHFQEIVPKSPHIEVQDPTFMKTMEFSKFQSSTKPTQEEIHHHMVKSTSSDTAMSLGTPVSASEVAAALLGASTSSLCGFRRHKRIEEEDLSTPYNHYKCLSPKDRVGKLLRRQFSLDRTEEINNEGSQNISPRLCKQNSAGAADLDKIEEASPRGLSLSPPSVVATLHGTLSISVDSLIH